MSQGFGGYREVTGFGLRSLGPRGTLAVVVILAAIAFSTYVSLKLTLLLIVAAIPVVALTLIPWGPAKRTVTQRAGRKLRSWWAQWRNADAYAAEVLREVPRGDGHEDGPHHLPGVLAPLLPLTVEDGRGGKQCLLWNRRTGILSAVLKVSPVGITLADEADADGWVRAYGGWLADLGFTPLISSVVFTTESSPTGGVDQRSYTLDRLSPSAPPVVRGIVERLVESSRATTADVQSRVTINFDLSKANPKPKTLAEGAAEVVRWLPRIESALAASGATVTSRASTGGVIRNIRAAFDPAIRSFLSEAANEEADELLRWEDAGPLRHEETTDIYQHDSGYSVTWVFTAPPASVIRQHVLLPLVSPGRYYRRFSMIYRPYTASEAAKIVEDEIQAGTLRRIWASKTKKDETQREYDDRVRARRAAQEESMGAGLGRFTMYVTTTTRNADTLGSACADVEERFGSAKLRFRRARGAMAATFAASLGYGIDPTSGLSRSRAERWLA